MKKIGLLCLALVLALGALGVGYAAWTDTITISGTVNTGTLNIDPVLFSSTYIYKDTDNETMAYYYVVKDAAGEIHCDCWDPFQPANTVLVASAVSTPGADDEVNFDYDGLFPCETLVCDVVLHYDGSVPAKVNEIDWTFSGDQGGDWITPLVTSGDVVGYARMFDPETHTTGDVVVEGTQLHECEYVVVWLEFHLPQDETLMNRSGSGSCTIEVVQWNEYPYTPEE
jgi:predicted ribosomally synthesized peptide with SipW-like signal peptide